MSKPNIKTDIWKHVDKSGGDNACWPYTGGRGHYGHGVFTVMGKSFQAHRVAFEVANGPIPNGLWILHKCDNPPCCNPAHLFCGTPKDNTQDMMKKGRAKWHKLPPMNGSKNPASRLSEIQVQEMRLLHTRDCVSLVRLSRIFGVSKTSVCNIISRRKWSHI